MKIAITGSKTEKILYINVHIVQNQYKNLSEEIKSDNLIMISNYENNNYIYCEQNKYVRYCYRKIGKILF